MIYNIYVIIHSQGSVARVAARQGVLDLNSCVLLIVNICFVSRGPKNIPAFHVKCEEHLMNQNISQDIAVTCKAPTCHL